ncbi:hypothetical protein IW261DRAFT_1608808 [Armillaria novae-zelandiae]|uniref:Transmembrane protein n=1 Tax=Armillaria novae-zelandiae TaxID=153914 RepID=A0AA39U5G6_9AGAR|nr:hypothetical protein IW261DRAFT_1608808 [Armillaria novae-zelandiae]
MPIDSFPTIKRVRCCFFSSLVFIVIIPVACIIFGKTLHPREFEYRGPASSIDDGTRIISLSADLVSADLKKGEVVLDWTITNDTGYYTSLANRTVINIYFAANLLQQSSINHSKPSTSNKPTDPTFIWNITASESDYYSDFPVFQTVSIILYSRNDDSGSKHPIRHSHTSEVYYPFDHYVATAFFFAEDTSTNAPVKLHLEHTSGLVGGLKIQANVTQGMSDNEPDPIIIEIDLQRGTLIKLYCIVITITFWLVTITICLLMIMTVGFGFRQRNEIVVVPISTVFAFTQLRSTMPGAPEGFGDILDFVGVLPCLVLLSICAITMVGIYIFTDPAKDSREQLTWSALVKALTWHRNVTINSTNAHSASESYDMRPLISASDRIELQRFDVNQA